MILLYNILLNNFIVLNSLNTALKLRLYHPLQDRHGWYRYTHSSSGVW